MIGVDKSLIRCIFCLDSKWGRSGFDGMSDALVARGG